MIRTLKFKHIMIILAGILLVSCEKVVYLDLNTADTRIVIEGNITSEPGPYEVRITTTGDYYTADGIAPISGALVIISDNFGSSDTLVEESSGVYLTQYLSGQSGNTYSLDIFHEDKEYSGSEALPYKVSIDSLSYFEIPPNSGPPPEDENNKVYNIFCNFKDPAEFENYYRFKLKINGEEAKSRGGNYNVSSDQLFNGQIVKYVIWYVEAAPLDTITIEMETIGFNTYEYYRTLNDALSSGGMGGTPYNPITNLSNNALGYFGAYTSDSMSVIIEE